MSDTQWPIFEVFHQRSRGEAHVHVGSIHAPDAGMALVLAKEQYGRHPTCVNLWVVAADDIHRTEYADADMFAPAVDKSYREAFGYDMIKAGRRAKEQLAREQEASTTEAQRHREEKE